MSDVPPKARFLLRLLAALMSAALLSYLVWRVGPAKLWDDVLKLGWGFTWVIALAGVSHCAKTWAWRLTLGNDKGKMSFLHLLGLRLGAEAAGQLGILGQTLGDSIRVSRLSSEIPIANGLASVSLDRGLYFVTGTIVTIAGILAALFMVSVPHVLRLYAVFFAIALIAFLSVALLAMRKRWPVLSVSARIVGRVSSFKHWMEKRYLIIQSVEDRLFDFHHETPNTFWASFSLNVGCQCLAVLEVCLILWLMGVKIGFLSALSMEALTKLLNTVGNFNPGNFGTYEGGTMLIGKIFGLIGATGLSLGLARRLRSLFWAAVGAICLVWLTKARKPHASDSGAIKPATTVKDAKTRTGAQSSQVPAGELAVAIFLANGGANCSHFNSPLSRVGSLPVLLRTILAAQRLCPSHIMIIGDPVTTESAQRELICTKRLPESVEWIETAGYVPLAQQLQLIAAHACSERLAVIDGNTAFHPSLVQKAGDWKGENSALALKSGDQLAGVHVLSAGTIATLAEFCPPQVGTPEELHAALAARHSVVCMPVPEEQWQRVSTLEDRRIAEEKLDRWLVKPTDGIFARMNRRISIPISRQLIKFPITANMVSIFTLGVGFVSGAFFAYGGYWHTLLGAFLCLWASILDGCDGEVARLKLQESAFGCWLETVCDYLSYLFLFVGMTLGLWRSSGTRAYLVWGCVLLFGAIASFLAVAWGRHRLAGERPEQLLGIWQARAESRRSNPLLFFGRHTEFITRRCFFPYALLFFALFNIMNVAFILSAIAANLVWPISLYSSRAFAGIPNRGLRSCQQVRLQPDPRSDLLLVK